MNNEIIVILGPSDSNNNYLADTLYYDYKKLKLKDFDLSEGNVVITDLSKIADAQELISLTRDWHAKTVVMTNSNLLEVSKLFVESQWNCLDLTTNY